MFLDQDETFHVITTRNQHGDCLCEGVSVYEKGRRNMMIVLEEYDEGSRNVWEYL